MGTKLLEWRNIYREKTSDVCPLVLDPLAKCNLIEQEFMVHNTIKWMELSRNDRGCKMLGIIGVLRRLELMLRLKLILRRSKDNIDVGISRQWH